MAYRMAVGVLAGCLATMGILRAQGLPKEGQGMRVFKLQEHWWYSGHFRITGNQGYLVGNLSDKASWDHIDNEGKTVHRAAGSIEIDVDEKANTGTCIATADLPEGKLRVEFTKFDPWDKYQDGGLASWIYEHGDSGNGDTLYPKTLLYLGGWGRANVFLDEKLLHQNYQAHFMVMQGSRDPKTMETQYPRPGHGPGDPPAGDVDPSRMEIDLWVRSEQLNNQNNPPREVFIHLMWMEVTWKH
ncbi:MAG: hypothetical protein HY652_01895 [Acidobacteria bacterium]|nr:hypothetical protein [Acidobacteriota bacterium]